MSACRLGTEPIHRLTAEQCDKMIKRCRQFENVGYFSADFNMFNRWESIGDRIQQYKDNLKSRGLK